MKQIHVLWCVVIMQGCAIAWLWKSQQNSTHYADVARIADAVSADSEIEKRLASLDEQVQQLIFQDNSKEQDTEERIAKLERQVDFALEIAHRAGSRVEDKPVTPLRNLAEELRRDADEARREVQQNDNERRLRRLEREMDVRR